MRRLSAVGLLALGMASATMADSPFNHGDDGDTILPITSYPLGQSQLVARSMARELRMHWIEQDLCDQVGCLVVHNDTKFYKVAEFHVQLLGPNGARRWGRNQLDHPLLPREKIVRLKLAPADSCERDIRFVLMDRRTKERLVMESSTNLCPTPHADNVIRINVKKAEVTVADTPD